jgi:O-antigen/teichoic acid export membrane protein
MQLDSASVAWAAAGIGLSLVFQVQQFVSRSQLQFNVASVQQLLMGVGILLATGWLALRGVATFADVAGGYSVAVAVAVLAGLVVRRPAIAAFDARTWRSQAGIGLPIMIAGALFTVLVTADRWVATFMLGPTGAAPYALASVVGSAMLVLPTVLSQQTYPRMAVAYGAERDEAAIARLARLQGRLSLAVSFPIAALVAVTAAFLVPASLPAYADAVVPIALVCGGYVALAGFLGFGNYLNVTGRQWRYLVVQVVALVAGAALMLGGAALAGAIGIALGMAITLAGYGLLLLLATAVRVRP